MNQANRLPIAATIA